MWRIFGRFFFFLNSSLPSSSFPCFFVLLLLPSGFGQFSSLLLHYCPLLELLELFSPGLMVDVTFFCYFKL